MQFEPEITFRDIEPSDAIRKAIEEKAAKLGQYHDRITACRVVVSAPHRHKHKGKIYEVSIDLSVPGDEIVTNQKPGDVNAHEDVYVAIRDAFAAATRQIQDRQRQRQGHVKSHDVPPHGRVVRLFSEQGYGFIEAVDGREYYFHRNSVLDDEFARIEVGQAVRFTPEQGVDGPQASSVQLVGKHHLGDFPTTPS